MPVIIGTSGWQYADWKGAFYPPSIKQAEWLGYYASRFDTVELNNPFYRLPAETTFADWAERVAAGFVFAVKASRYLTHVKRLKDPGEPVQRLLAAASGLGPKLGPVLLQLPPTLRADADGLATALDCFPRRVRVAVEARHPSWYDDRIRRVLEDHSAAWVLVDPESRDRPHWVTADWGYLRLHAGRSQPEPCYGRKPLDTWAKRLAELWPAPAEVFCYFNNDHNSCAPRDARRFAAAVARTGREPSGVPSTKETPLATQSAR